jgi:hypothetical protein
MFYVNYSAMKEEREIFDKSLTLFKQKYPGIHKKFTRNYEYELCIFNTKEYKEMFPNIIRIPQFVENIINEMIDNHPEALEYLIINKFINLSEAGIEDIFQSNFENYKIIEYVLCNFDVNQSIKSVGFDVAISNNNINVAKLIYNYIEDKEEFSNFFIENFDEHISDIKTLSIETFDYVWKLFHVEFGGDLIRMVDIITPKNLVLLEYIISKIPEDVNKNLLINILKSLIENGKVYATFDLMMKKFKHKLTPEEIRELDDLYAMVPD